MNLEIKDNRMILRLSLQDQAAAAAAASAAKAQQALSNIYTGKATGTHITYDKNKVYHLPTAPGTGAITQDNEGAIFGISQKIYHQADEIPPMPETWVRMGGSYDVGQLNTIYVEWISEDRQEYWIVTDDPTPKEDGLSAYEIAVKNGFEGTEEEWLLSLRGEDGYTPQKGADYEDGREVEFQKSATHIQWRYVGEAGWTNLVALTELKGEDGYTPQKGVDYEDGEDGREVEIQISATHIQWRYVGEAEWTNLVALTDLKGEDGYTPQKDVDYTDGQDGREVEFQKSATHIQWRYAGEAGWTNLVALADIKGEDGYTPQKGVDYTDGEDGREIEIQKSATHIQWRYEGDSTWIDLVSLTDLKGVDGYTPQKGTDYDDGQDGREVEFQKSATHIQWRYVGDTTWTNLVALEDITGPDGDPADTSMKLDKSVQFGPDISGSITLSEADNSKLREITATSTVNIPSVLLNGWNTQLVNIGSGDVTITSDGPFRNGPINKLKPGKGCSIYKKDGIVNAIGLEA